MNVVLIPCFDRPEFLYYTLRNIEKAENSENYIYLFAIDSGYNHAILDIIDGFKLNKKILIRKKSTLSITKQSFNVLESYKFACMISDELIFLIEDDIMIARDFFAWHEDIMKQVRPFVSIATRNNNSRFNVKSKPNAYYIGNDADYQSLGVCFHKDTLTNLILEHANDSYYKNPVMYCQKLFPATSIGKQYAEQDGLIRRVKEAGKHQSIFPHVPRAYHAGFYSYNRNLAFKKPVTLSERIEFVGNALADPVMYKQCCGKEQFYNDSMQCDLETNHNKIEYEQAKTI